MRSLGLKPELHAGRQKSPAKQTIDSRAEKKRAQKQTAEKAKEPDQRTRQKPLAGPNTGAHLSRLRVPRQTGPEPQGPRPMVTQDRLDQTGGVAGDPGRIERQDRNQLPHLDRRDQVELAKLAT